MPVPALLSRARRAAAGAVAAALLAGGLVVAAPTAASAATWYRYAPAAAKAYPTLRLGSTGTAVRYLQQRLYVRPSGWFGPSTLAKVRNWQWRKGLPVDGRIDSRDWRELRVPYSPTARRGTVEARKRAAILRWARAQTGDRYAIDGDGPDAFDCSGFTQYVYRHAIGYALPRSPTGQMNAVRRITRAQARPGDLVFVRSGSGSRHAAIYAGGDHWYEAADFTRPVGKARIWTDDIVFGTVL